MKNSITIKVSDMQYNQIINGGSMLSCSHDRGFHLGDKLRIQLNECNYVFVYAYVIELVSKGLGLRLIKIKVPEIHVGQ